MSYPPDVERTELFIHLSCSTVITWTEGEIAEYGPLADQGCDCESLGGGEDNWRPVYVGRPVQ
jgi:hypothetical protein